jgi:hypothetical protein
MSRLVAQYDLADDLDAAWNAPGVTMRTRQRLGVCRIALVDRDNPHKEVRFAGDSPLEGDGFEPSVPRERAGSAVSRRLSAYLEGREKRLRRMLDSFKRYGVAPSAGSAHLS